jgi:hypothetical protein
MQEDVSVYVNDTAVFFLICIVKYGIHCSTVATFRELYRRSHMNYGDGTSYKKYFFKRRKGRHRRKYFFFVLYAKYPPLSIYFPVDFLKHFAQEQEVGYNGLKIKQSMCSKPLHNYLPVLSMIICDGYFIFTAFGTGCFLLRCPPDETCGHFLKGYTYRHFPSALWGVLRSALVALRFSFSVILFLYMR